LDLYGKSVLIIGGTGSIGQHLLFKILESKPKVVRIFSRDEYKQFELQQVLCNYSNIRYLIGDIRDEKRLLRAMENIDYVFHLAAMKHVPACEYNPFEAVKTNVIGTQNVIQSAISAGVNRVLFTSTDKAISPTNTYGATKLTAERLISAAEYQKGPKQTIFSSVRFGNVMGSRGSVIPLFKRQILEERRVTVTNLDMIRYMMTPTQAISLMIKANQLAYGGEVFVLKMPKLVLSDLVQAVIEEVTEKYKITEAIKVEEIGSRPGEKMFEELMTEDEARVAIETEEMYILQPPFNKKGRIYNETPVSPVSPFLGKAIDKIIIRKWLNQEKLL
jgi:UDP-N-acetylglucosamine 4,6-dehydratase